MNGAYVHLMVNHLPVVGSIIGLLLLAAAMLRRSTELQVAGLALLVLNGLAALAAYWSGEPAEDVVEGLAGVSKAAIEGHEDLAVFALASAGVTAAAALGGLIWIWRAKRVPMSALSAALALCVITVGLMAVTAHSGGTVRHSEISQSFVPSR